MARSNAGNQASGRTQAPAREPITLESISGKGFDPLAAKSALAGDFARTNLTALGLVTEAAYLTFALERDEYLYSDAAHNIPTADYATEMGLRSAGNVSLWRTLGYTLAVVGISPDCDEYKWMRNATPSDLKKFLCRNRDHGNKPGEAPAVPTVDEALTEIRKFYKDGKPIRKAAAATPPTGEKDGAESGTEGGEGTGTEITLTPFQSATVALDSFGISAKSVTDDEWAHLVALLEGILERENTIRAAAAAATPAA